MFAIRVNRSRDCRISRIHKSSGGTPKHPIPLPLPLPLPTVRDPNRIGGTGNFASHNFVSSLDAAYKNFAESSCFVKLSRRRLKARDSKKERDREGEQKPFSSEWHKIHNSIFSLIVFSSICIRLIVFWRMSEIGDLQTGGRQIWLALRLLHLVIPPGWGNEEEVRWHWRQTQSASSDEFADVKTKCKSAKCRHNYSAIAMLFQFFFAHCSFPSVFTALLRLTSAPPRPHPTPWRLVRRFVQLMWVVQGGAWCCSDFHSLCSDFEMNCETINGLPRLGYFLIPAKGIWTFFKWAFLVLHSLFCSFSQLIHSCLQFKGAN